MRAVVIVSMLASASAFAALPHLPTRHRHVVAVSPPAAVTVQLSSSSVPAPKNPLMAAMSAVVGWTAKVNLAGLEYIGYALLAFWGMFCVTINYFLWVFRYAIEKSGLAPDSWDPQNKKL